jgi:GNAT superfamily N-acetyltransferase
MTCEVVRLRDALRTEAGVLEALQRRSSDVWPAYREQLAANPDAISLPQSFIDNGWVRVAVAEDHTAVGFSVVMQADAVVHELDGLFVDPAQMNRGFGRGLVEDAARRSIAGGARHLEVTAGPARGFYESVAFEVVVSAETRFGPAVRMRRDLRRADGRERWSTAWSPGAAVPTRITGSRPVAHPTPRTEAQ